MSVVDYKKCSYEFTYKNRQFNGYTTESLLDEVCKFEFLSTDILTSTFPRSGTTLTEEIIWQIKNRKTVIKNELVDDITLRFPFMEFNYKTSLKYSKSFIELLNSSKNDPYRLIKTHVPYDFIRNNFEKVKPKMIIAMRNVKDCLVSNYYFYLKVACHEWQGSFDDFFHLFINGKTYTGSYFDNNLEWWNLRNENNILILFYEDIVRNTAENVIKIAEFLDEKLTVEEIDKIVHNCSFSTMANNPNINMKFQDEFTFLRKGIIGDWKNYFSEEQNKIMNDKIQEKFNNSGLDFVYE